MHVKHLAQLGHDIIEVGEVLAAPEAPVAVGVGAVACLCVAHGAPMRLCFLAVPFEFVGLVLFGDGELASQCDKNKVPPL